MVNQIIRVYNTEANALAGGTTGLISSDTVDSNGGAIHNNSDSIPYFLYNRYYYRIDSNEPVIEFHIDWDDGEDNSILKRNLQIIKKDTPSFFTVVPHVYTEAKRFFPLIRVKSIEGYLSKFYTNDSSDNSFVNLEATTLTADQNEFSQVSLEAAGKDLIPHFLPSNLSPISILKTDRKRVLAGIDNRPIDNTTTANYPLLYAYSSSTNTLGSANLVKLTMQTRHGATSAGASGPVKEYIFKGNDIIDADEDLNSAAVVSSGADGEVPTKAAPFGNYQTGSDAFEVTSFKFVTGSGAPTNGSASDLQNDYIIIFNGGFAYLIWFDVSGSDTAPSGIEPGGIGGFKATVEIALHGITVTNNIIAQAISDGVRTNTDFAAAFGTPAVSGQLVTFTATTHENQPDPAISDTVHITGPGDGNTIPDDYVTTEGSSNVTLTDCANKLLKAELLNVGKIDDDERIYIKVFSANQSSLTGNADVIDDDTICVLSNGNPIVDLNDAHSSVTLDGSESFTKASNLSISNYYFDDDNLDNATIQSPSGLPSGDLMSATNSLTNVSVTAVTKAATEDGAQLTITFTNPPTADETIILVDANGLSKTYTAHASSTSGLNFSRAGATTAVVDALDARIQANGQAFTVTQPSSTTIKLVSTKYIGNTSDEFQMTSSTYPKKTLSFTNSNKGYLTDSDDRFLDYNRLIRLQVEDNYTEVTGQLDLSSRRSFVEHYNDDQYVSTVNSGVSRIPTDQQSRGYIALSNHDTDKSATWFNLDALYNLDDVMMGGSSTYVLRHDADIDTADAVNTVQPNNWLFACKTDIFDRIYFRLDNTYIYSDSAIDIDITAYYATSGGWKPLEMVDGTKRLQTSGSIKFKKPFDWVKIKSSDIESGNWSGPILSTTSGSSKSGHDPNTMWDFDAYGILIGVQAKAAATKIQVTNIWPHNNTHSQLIKVVDPHHVSLNNIAIAQSVSFNRSGKYQTMTDRFGKSEIRKIGVNGGDISFGGVDLGDTNAAGNRKQIKAYQQNATPVYLDVTHKSGEKTRFFGVITSMSEDHPVGNQTPKYGVKMQISHIIELDSSNNLLSGKISIGGNIDDARKFVSSS